MGIIIYQFNYFDGKHFYALQNITRSNFFVKKVWFKYFCQKSLIQIFGSRYWFKIFIQNFDSKYLLKILIQNIACIGQGKAHQRSDYVPAEFVRDRALCQL